ncbi:hypothetical protein HHK36_002034 [Tetracentron sinense]|uniref:non-specific serine/threonine protein kinase n=1 Tax=Tetracentron sinense TaxID=13715 RepID=A0A834ZUE9_TETSI|nr:hypothetical protein HHK36_002034 [Tetracentron sinense]
MDPRTFPLRMEYTVDWTIPCISPQPRKIGSQSIAIAYEAYLPLFDLVTISTATDNFSNANKLGEGGFGPVYKGKLLDGQEIGVKRLSKNSLQGVDELKNEIISISKLQHNNLVRLLGCCIQGEEKMLIYEYMSNKSLDSFIFDQTRRSLLDWQKRFNIILGIARGLLYLHQDSRLRIIHRDLKASNILLDRDMNPKISDFGMARIFGGDQVEASTSRVVGTYGYMSPEYAIDGHFSIKSDVFSFGVLVLEIVTGQKNRGFYHPNHQLNLLGHAWRLWNEDKALELIDESMSDSFLATEVLRCIHVALLCVQQRVDDRPTMSTVVLMLGSESAMVPTPQQPGFFTERYHMNPNSAETLSCCCFIIGLWLLPVAVSHDSDLVVVFSAPDLGEFIPMESEKFVSMESETKGS